MFAAAQDDIGVGKEHSLDQVLLLRVTAQRAQHHIQIAAFEHVTEMIVGAFLQRDAHLGEALQQPPQRRGDHPLGHQRQAAQHEAPIGEAPRHGDLVAGLVDLGQRQLHA